MINWLATKLRIREWLLMKLGARKVEVARALPPHIFMAVAYAGSTDTKAQLNVLFSEDLRQEGFLVLGAVALRATATVLVQNQGMGMEEAIEAITRASLDKSLLDSVRKFTVRPEDV